MRPFTLVLVVAALAAILPASATAAVRRHPCRDAPAGTRCGSVTVPLDRSAAVRGRLRIEFERYPRRDRTRPAAGTMLAIEGGPGSSRLSISRIRSSASERIGHKSSRSAKCAVDADHEPLR